jgi:integrase
LSLYSDSIPQMLTESLLQTLKPQEKAYKKHDVNGLYIYVSHTGAKSWRYNYAVNGKNKTATLGQYPELNLKKARAKLALFKADLESGVSVEKRTFKQCALEFGKRKINGWDEKHKQYRRLELYVYPHFGNVDITDVTRTQVLEAVRRIEDKGTGETAHRVLNLVGQVFRYAIHSGYIENDPTPALKGALKSVDKGHFAAIIEEKDFAKLLLSIHQYEGTEAVKAALKLAPLLVVRPGELRSAKWKDFDFQAKEWRFFVTKTKQNHIVPLCKSAIAILTELKKYTGDGEYLFPSPRSKTRCISDTALLVALRSLGYTSEQHTIHGFRASFRTLAAEKLGTPEHLLEHQLAHSVRDPLGRAYNRATHLDSRLKLMEAWSEYIDDLLIWGGGDPFEGR